MALDGTGTQPQLAPPQVRATRPRARIATRIVVRSNRREVTPTKTSQEKMTERVPRKKAVGGRANTLQRPLQPSAELAAVVGPGPLPRGEVVGDI